MSLTISWGVNWAWTKLPAAKILNINKVLTSFFNENNLKAISFRKTIIMPNFYTNAIINLIEDINKAIDNKQFVCGVFIDIQEVFGTAGITTLCWKSYHTMVLEAE